MVGYAGRDFEPAPYAETVVAVVAGMVARVLETGATGLANVEQQNAGPFGVRYASGTTSTAPWLSAADKVMLRPFRRGGGIASMQFVGERYAIVEDD